MKKIVTILIILTIFASFIKTKEINTFASEIENNEKNIEVEEIIIGNTINIVLKNDNVTSYYYKYNDVITSNSLIINVNDGYGKIEFFTTINNNIYKDEFYYYNKNNYTFTSFYSEDSALNKGLSYLKEKAIITNEAASNIFNEYYDNLDIKKEVNLNANSININNNILNSSSTTSIAKGYLSLQFQTKNDSVTIIPFRYVKIELYSKIDGTSTSIGSTYTNEQGYFEIEYENQNVENYDLYYRTKLESYTFNISTTSLYTAKSDTISNVNDGDITNFESIYYIYDTHNLYDAMQIHQAMVLVQELVRSIYPTALDGHNLHVNYPHIFESTYCILGECYIYEGRFTEERFYTPMHEYSHFVQQSMGFYSPTLWELLRYESEHFETDDNIAVKDDKSYAMKLTWVESWATAFALISQYENVDIYENCKYFLDKMIDYEKADPHNYSNSDSNSNTNTNVIKNMCEGQELTVIGFLWDIYDNSTMYDNPVSEVDNITMSAQNWFNLTTFYEGEPIETLNDFTNSLLDNEADDLIKYGELLSYHRISPEITSVTNSESVSKTTPPIITFTEGGSDSNHNDLIELVIYGYNFVMIDKIQVPIIKNNTDNNDSNNENSIDCSFEVPQDFWNSIGTDLYNTQVLYMFLQGYRTNEPISGPYFSNFIKFTIEYDHLCLYNFRYVSNKDGISHQAYCTCGKSKKEICMTNFDIPGVTKCDKCSQKLNFVPIIHDNIVDIMSIYKKDEYMEEIEN